MSEERCVCCGKVIPEGSQVCVICGYEARKEKQINNLYLLNKKAIVSALEKQIPKKPTPHTVEPIEAPIKIGNVNWCKGTTIYHCPNCKDFISRVYTYCHKCGQALDWSDTE